jgi:hypothetical protein
MCYSSVEFEGGDHSEPLPNGGGAFCHVLANSVLFLWARRNWAPRRRIHALKQEYRAAWVQIC